MLSRNGGAMKTLLLSLLLLLTPLRLALAADLELQPGTKVAFASREEAAKLLVERDAFVQALSPFDRSARLKTDKETSEKAYLDFVAAQAADWTDEERTRVEGLLT